MGLFDQPKPPLFVEMDRQLPPIKRLVKGVKDLFVGQDYYQREEPVVRQESIGDILHTLESDKGKNPNTPRSMKSSYTIPSRNANEKPRKVVYDTGFAGEFGITPIRLADYGMSEYDRTSASFTEHGLPLLPGRNITETHKKLNTMEGARQLATEMFLSKRLSKDDWSPESLARDYMDTYVTKASPNYTKENYNRALKVFNEYIK